MIISLQYDDESGLYEIWCQSKGMGPMPCGPRIFHIPPVLKPGTPWTFPKVKFSHSTKVAAEADAETIRKYLADLPERKMTKKDLKEHGA